MMVADVDNDTHYDLFLVDLVGTNKLYRNLGPLGFEEIGAAVGLADASNSTASTWQDFDGDGDLDVFVTNYEQGNRMYLNNHGFFTDSAFGTSLSDSDGRSTWAASGDYNGDGDIDLFVCAVGQPNRLYRNGGNATFTDVSGPLAISDTSVSTYAAMFVDLGPDVSDGPAIYVVNWDAPNELYLQVNQSFVDVAELLNASDSGYGRTVAWGDYDNDGDQDIYIGNHGKNVLLRNDIDVLGINGFSDVTLASGADDANSTQIVHFADADDDGFLDLYLENSEGSKRVFMNQGDGTFSETDALDINPNPVPITGRNEAVLAATMDGRVVDLELSD
jgi:hypothetical protein